MYYFSTAWWGPESWLKHVAALHPALHFELLCAEPNTDQCGRLVLERGAVIDEVVHQGFEDVPCDAFLREHDWFVWPTDDEEDRSPAGEREPDLENQTSDSTARSSNEES